MRAGEGDLLPRSQRPKGTLLALKRRHQLSSRDFFHPFEDQLAQPGDSRCHSQRYRAVVHDLKSDLALETVMDRRSSHMNHEPESSESTSSFHPGRRLAVRWQRDPLQGRGDDKLLRPQNHRAIRLRRQGFHVGGQIRDLNLVEIEADLHAFRLVQLGLELAKVIADVKIQGGRRELIVCRIRLDEQMPVLNGFPNLSIGQNQRPTSPSSGQNTLSRHADLHGIAASGRRNQYNIGVIGLSHLPYSNTRIAGWCCRAGRHHHAIRVRDELDLPTAARRNHWKGNNVFTLEQTGSNLASDLQLLDHDAPPAMAGNTIISLIRAAFTITVP